MGEVKLPYYVVKGARGYFQPTKRMKELGFQQVALGKDGPDAWRKAREWADRWDLARRGLDKATVRVWPRGSLGEAFDRFKRTEIWASKATRTREEWHRAWRYIEPIFGDVSPATVDLETIDEFYADPKVGLLATAGVREAHRVIKVWRALWRVAAAMGHGYCERDRDPSLAIRRRSPQPRSATWREGEVVRLVKAAIRKRYHGLACVLVVAWDTQFSPGDVRKLTPLQMAYEDGRALFHTKRAKTGTAAIGTLSRRAERVLAAYLSSLDAQPLPTAPLFRNRSGRAYSKDTLGDDFRDIRDSVFPGDKRQLLDFRRSGTVEAFAGGADPSAVASKMANNINQSSELQRTYNPVNKASVASADEARKRGRRAIRENN
jgi:hypothetical protein